MNAGRANPEQADLAAGPRPAAAVARSRGTWLAASACAPAGWTPPVPAAVPRGSFDRGAQWVGMAAERTPGGWARRPKEPRAAAWLDGLDPVLGLLHVSSPQEADDLRKRSPVLREEGVASLVHAQLGVRDLRRDDLAVGDRRDAVVAAAATKVGHVTRESRSTTSCRLRARAGLPRPAAARRSSAPPGGRPSSPRAADRSRGRRATRHRTACRGSAATSRPARRRATRPARATGRTTCRDLQARCTRGPGARRARATCTPAPGRPSRRSSRRSRDRCPSPGGRATPRRRPRTRPSRTADPGHRSGPSRAGRAQRRRIARRTRRSAAGWNRCSIRIR